MDVSSVLSSSITAPNTITKQETSNGKGKQVMALMSDEHGLIALEKLGDAEREKQRLRAENEELKHLLGWLAFAARKPEEWKAVRTSGNWQKILKALELDERL